MCVRCVDDAACEAHEEQLESLPQIKLFLAGNVEIASGTGQEDWYGAGINIDQQRFSSISLPTDEPKRAAVSVPARPSNYLVIVDEAVFCPCHRFEVRICEKHRGA